MKKSEISAKIQPGHRILTYPIRSMFDVLLYRNRLATLSEVTEINAEEGVLRFSLKGLRRAFLKKIHRFQSARYEEADAGEADLPDPELLFTVKKKAQELLFLINSSESDRLITLLNYMANLGQMTDFISNYFVSDFRDRYRLFRELDVAKRSVILSSVLDSLIGKEGKEAGGKPS